MKNPTINKHITLRITLMLMFMLTLASCDKYLDIEPKGKRLLKTVEDYDKWLNSTSLAYVVPNGLIYMEDAMDIPYITAPYLSNNAMYTWQLQYAFEPTAVPAIWNSFYKPVNYYNTVISGIDGADAGTDQQKRSIKAEALLGRAFDYLYLVNLYGKLYNAASAPQDPAVPFVTSNDLNTPTPARSSVKEIYDHIIADLTTAIPDLPANNNTNRFRGSVAAAYSILARTYLYMGDYAKAAQHAQLALDKGPNTVRDYSNMSGAGDIGPLFGRPDAIYASFLESTYLYLTPAQDYLKSFDKRDLRLAFFFSNQGDYTFNTRGATNFVTTDANTYVNCGTTVAEMRLIMAEAAARASNLSTAIQQLDLVRKCRFKSTDYAAAKYDPANPNQEDVLKKVLQERTFEFAFNGLRWLDMRRLDAEGRMPELKRYDGQGNVIATLPRHSKRYTLQIPDQVLQFNPGWTQNPAD